MANGEECIRCGCQETDHDLKPELTCGAFQSEIRHDTECSVVGCNGNCAEFMAAKTRNEEAVALTRGGLFARLYGEG